MESTQLLNNHERLAQLKDWLRAACALSDFKLLPLQAQASMRRYYRVQTSTTQYVLMDAPPQENIANFVNIAHALGQLNVPVPHIFNQNLTQGMLLLTDFGDATLLHTLSADSAGADHWYRHVLELLAQVQACHTIPNLPIFDAAWMWQEWLWFKQWFLVDLLKLEGEFALSSAELCALDQCLQECIYSISAQPYVFMHRDFHSGNIMCLPEAKLGLLDFQDAFLGPITYDLASVLRDCYIDWPKEQVSTWALYYYELLNQKNQLREINATTFLNWFDKMSVQRHLKALFTFARKAIRDHDLSYLSHVPRTLNYLISVSSIYPELAVLHRVLAKKVLPRFQQRGVSV